MTFRNKKFQKICAVLLLFSTISMGLTINPKKAEAGWPVIDAVGNALKALILTKQTTQTVIATKNVLKEILKQVAMAAAKRLLAELTKSTVNWINSGFYGKPLFLENPDSFFEDITRREIRTLVDIFGYNSARYPYGRSWSLGVIGAYKRALDQNAAYSLSQVEWNATQAEREAFLQAYRSNFNLGGWNSFLLHTQYPQNNAIGFMMIANEELARRTNTSQDSNSPIGKIKQGLQQGLGFLSQEACSTNPSLKTNPYNPPTFAFKPSQYLLDQAPKEQDYLDENGNIDYNAYNDAYDLYKQDFDDQKDAARLSWEDQNTCKGPWVKNTPGFVAASQITRALGSKFAQSELGQALGGSLSAIFDALLSKLFDSGLNALASKRNPPPQNEDNWSYEGQTLGSPNDPNSDIFLGPDQEVVLQDFKKRVLGKTIVTAADESTTEEVGDTGQGEYIPGDIYNTNRELALLDNQSSLDWGMMQYLSAIWPKVRQLDICLPGPNYGWEERLDDQVSRFNDVINKEIGQDDVNEQREGGIILKEVKFAASFFKDWIRNKMLLSLPSAYKFLNAINTLEDYQQMVKDIRYQISRKREALAMLGAVKNQLETFTDQPSPGSPEEKRLIEIWKLYEATRPFVSNNFSVDDAKSQRETLRETLTQLNTYTVECAAERQEKKWTIPPPDNNGDRWSNSYGTASFNTNERDKILTIYGGRSVRGRPIVTNDYRTDGTEREQFCSLPAYNGYSHGEYREGDALFENPLDPRIMGPNVLYPELPLLGGAFKTATMGTKTVRVDCNDIFRSYSTDYKGDIPGGLIIEIAPTPDTIDPGAGTSAPPPPTPPPPPPPPPCDPATDPNCIPADCGGAGQIACS